MTNGGKNPLSIIGKLILILFASGFLFVGTCFPMGAGAYSSGRSFESILTFCIGLTVVFFVAALYFIFARKSGCALVIVGLLALLGLLLALYYVPFMVR